MIRVILSGLFGTVAGLMWPAASMAGSAHVATVSLSRSECTALVGFRIPSGDIGLPTKGATVTAAVWTLKAVKGAENPPSTRHTSAGTLNAFCLVSGRIRALSTATPAIEFRVALPSRWNTKVLMLGGGGFDGFIPDVQNGTYTIPAGEPTPLERGFAVFGSDGGHRAPRHPAGTIMVASDGAYLTSEGAYKNWMGDALKKTRDAAVGVITRAYNARTTKAYFVGGSSGGREALMVAGRWPHDWDGVVAFYPARGQMTLFLGQQETDRLLAVPGAWLSRGKRQALYSAELAACDDLDGAVDGIISNVAACNATFNPFTAVVNGKRLRCKGGRDVSDSCLSDLQIATLRKLNAPYHFAFALRSGATEFPGYNVFTSDLGRIESKVGTGATKRLQLENEVSFLALGDIPPASPTRSGMSISVIFNDGYLRYGILRDPEFDFLDFNPSQPGRYLQRIQEMSKIDAYDKDLTAFAKRGGKLIIIQGLADTIIPPRLTERYYRHLVKTMGANRVETFLRFYTVPAWSHGVSTTFQAKWDWLSAIDRWSGAGVDPGDRQVITDAIGVPGRTRPLCEYPGWPKYNGSGDINRAASFTCAVSGNAYLRTGDRQSRP